MKVLFVGSAVVDVVAKLPNEARNQSRVSFKIGTKNELAGMAMRFGGSAANAAVTAVKLGHQARILTAIGADEFGKLVAADLAANGVRGSVVKVDNQSTSASVVLLAGHEKTALTFHGALEELSHEDLNEADIDWCDAVFITSLTSDKNMALVRRLVSLAKSKRKKLVFAPSMTMLKAQLEAAKSLHCHFDIVIMNEEEAEVYTGGRHLDTMLVRMQGATRVITRGRKGAIAMINGRIVTSNAVDEGIVDTTGAGDCFSSAFATEYFATSDLDKAMAIATAAAALKMRKIGAHLQYTRAEVEKLAATRKVEVN